MAQISRTKAPLAHLRPAAIPVAATTEQEQQNNDDNQQRKERHLGSPLSVAYLINAASFPIDNSQRMRHVDAIYATDVPQVRDRARW
jgi:hypothetical protein